MKTLSMLLSLIPQILQAIIGVESVITTAKSGQAKKDIVIASIGAVAAAGETADNKLVSAISAFVDSTVVTLNKSGIFATSK